VDKILDAFEDEALEEMKRAGQRLWQLVRTRHEEALCEAEGVTYEAGGF